MKTNDHNFDSDSYFHGQARALSHPNAIESIGNSSQMKVTG